MLMLVCFATPPPAAGSAPHAASRTSTPAVAAETGIMRAPPRTATLGHGDDEPAASLQVAYKVLPPAVRIRLGLGTLQTESNARLTSLLQLHSSHARLLGAVRRRRAWRLASTSRRA